MSALGEAQGPVVVWENYGYEGWQPRSYPDMKSALLGERHNSEFVVTRVVEFAVVEQTVALEQDEVAR